jgi:predicted ester cyclase
MQIQIERVRDGRIVEHWRVPDESTLMRQLGVVP